MTPRLTGVVARRLTGCACPWGAYIHDNVCATRVSVMTHIMDSHGIPAWTVRQRVAARRAPCRLITSTCPEIIAENKKPRRDDRSQG